MEKNNKKDRTFRSMDDFRKEYFPDDFEKEKEEKPTDARAIGISYAKESLEKIRKKLAV